MHSINEPKLQILTGSAYPEIAELVAKELGVDLCKVSTGAFSNGEISFKILDSVRGDDVFVMQSHCGNVNDAIMEQAIIIDAVKRASARSITAICPFLAYARQDRKSSGREPISARLVIDILAQAGADRIMSVDLHSGQIQGFMNGPFDHLIARPILLKYIADNFSKDGLVIVSPDAGRVKSAERYISDLGCEMAIIHKHRSTKKHNTVEARHLIGNVKGKTCVVIDDMIDTAGTLCAAADILANSGAKEIYGVATHGLFSGPAVERINASSFKQIITTDTLPHIDGFDKSLVLSISPLIAQAINAGYSGGSISAIFGGNNQY